MTHRHHGADRVQARARYHAATTDARARRAGTPGSDRIVVEHTSDKKLSINMGPVELPNLEQRLREIHQDRHDKTLYVAAAGRLRCGDIVTVIDAARAPASRVSASLPRVCVARLRLGRRASVYEGGCVGVVAAPTTTPCSGGNEIVQPERPPEAPFLVVDTPVHEKARVSRPGPMVGHTADVLSE